jgi:hypothetical protein
MRPWAAALALAAAILAATAGGSVRSDASFTTTSGNAGNLVATDSAVNYLRLWSQSTDPAGLGNYALRQPSTTVRAATGSDETLIARLGGYRNANDTAVTRVFTIQARDPLPDGVGAIEVTHALSADPATGFQPLKSVRYADPATGVVPPGPVTLTAGQKRQVDVTLNTRGLPGNSTLLAPVLTLNVRYQGYTGSFLNYPVTIKVFDGNGAGPD